jgi:Domain of unknown function (DUF4263)
MKQLDTLVFDQKTYERELADFEQLLINSTTLQEQADILPFFRARKYLCARIASLVFNFSFYQTDRIAFEYDLFGDFVCDLVVGNSQTNDYCFIEFENASVDSIFIKKKGRYESYYSCRFEQGYSQVADWFYQINDVSESQITKRFDTPKINYHGALIIGRNSFLSETEKKRLIWRRRNFVVNSQHILIYTFDQLLAFLKNTPTH